jgi:SAM-dependent methyltransferase
MGNPWDDRYSAKGFYYGSEPNDFLKAMASRITPGGRVLCLAEGEGRNAVYLAKLGFRVLAVDGSEVGLKKATAFARENGVSIETKTTDLEAFRILPETFDAIVSIWCHLPNPLRTRIHQESVAGLRSGGVFILEAYRPKQLEYKTGGPPVAELMMNLVDLKQELQGLHLPLAVELDREIHEGTGHVGLSAVVQVLGMKS